MKDTNNDIFVEGREIGGLDMGGPPKVTQSM
jgi:hypothetical protein